MTSRLSAIALASQSPRRYQLLRSIGLHVHVVPSGYDEQALDVAGMKAREMALAHAVGKAQSADITGPSVLIAADTIVECDGKILGKPCDARDATRMLRMLSQRKHFVYTGFALLDRAAGRRVVDVVSTAVTFVALADKQIERYVASGEPMDKAGAYGVQGIGALFVASIAGDYYTVMGLPLARLGRACAELGYELL